MIEPENKSEGDRQIGTLVTEILEYTPGVMFVNRIERPKYINDERQELKIGIMPERPVDKSQFGIGLMTNAIVQKYMDHNPLYRQLEQMKRMHQVDISRSSFGESVQKHIELLTPIYEALKKEVLQQKYLQTDESPFKVQSETKKGSTDLGFMWVSRVPEKDLVLFSYQKGRSGECMNNHLQNFKGKLQTDGWKVYEQLEGSPEIELFNCWAHARRYFDQAKENDPKIATYMLKQIQILYEIEQYCRDQKLNIDERKKIRQEKSKVQLEKIKEFLDQQSMSNILPQSPVGKAIAYSLSRCDRLRKYVDHGEIEIDNNLIENSIRPLALGRENFLFAGSHESAHRAAMIYSLFGTCKINRINPHEWLKNILSRIKNHLINRIAEILPHNWNSLQEYAVSRTDTFKFKYG
ncbi:MAG: IS66 family transposase [Saprospiraceae bacterium]